MDQLEELSKYSELFKSLIIKYGTKVILAAITLIVGLWIIGVITRSFKKILKKREVDPTLTPFLVSITNIGLKVMLGVSVLSMLGVAMTSFVAILGAAGLAVGLALQGTLQNFAGGVLILGFRPFKVGDFIEAQGYMGTVEEIQIFNTILLTVDNKTVIIPNGGLSTGSMINFSAQKKRRVDFTFGIAYGDDVKKAKEIMQSVIDSDERILKGEDNFIGLIALADSSVNFTVRVWVNAENYWPVYFDTNEKMYDALSNGGLNIPFPQMDVHLHKTDDQSA
ncbi:mechanosensitive ion channel family protein [Aureibacter tunicatorum]|uniref:Small conductance mechanosensitive channel n=1 Tax=Aureibacter tunicatorum TaxID=866807 RepID=A0AAE3XLM2_9BACT|nr:mechanosensitive ion channel domain-containing protein [Aureibacter tunicatorum]MDR6239162.1 small conductance mechanosensitive channel [Aureibacter tunicatorum]